MDILERRLIKINKIFITSDWHFNHDKSFLYEPRGFTSIEEMNQQIIANYNSLVGSQDICYCLGDCCLGGPDSLFINKTFIEQLNGYKYIIIGNHCTEKRIEMYKTCNNTEVVGYANVIKYNKYHFYLSHYPTVTSNYDVDKPLKARVINLCGHTHTKNKFQDIDKGLIYHCELDAHNNFPVLLDDIIEDMENEVKICKSMGLE